MSDSSLGCYSVVRYRDALSDQQINLGVLLWHPQEGFRVFFVPDLEGVRTISPKIPSQDLRFRLSVIQEEVSHNGKSGSDKFVELANWFRDGIEVTSPYPARFADLDSALHLLKPTLFPQMPTEARELSLIPSNLPAMSFQHAHVTQFERRVFRTIEHAAKDRHVQAHPVAPRKIGKVIVNPGFETLARKHKALWRVVSFRSNDNPERRVFAAKAAAMEMFVLAKAPAYKNHLQLVIVPAQTSLTSENEPIAWLEKTANHVWPVSTPEAAAQLLDRALK
jgi:hypothetical protein